jgi:hypothetical protein
MSSQLLVRVEDELASPFTGSSIQACTASASAVDIPGAQRGLALLVGTVEVDVACHDFFAFVDLFYGVDRQLLQSWVVAVVNVG